MNNTQNKNNVRNASNTNSARKFTSTDSDSPATDNQRRAIGHAIKNGSWKRFSAEDWKNLTKGRVKEAGTFAGPYLHPDDPTPAAA